MLAQCLFHCLSKTPVFAKSVQGYTHAGEVLYTQHRYRTIGIGICIGIGIGIGL